MISFCAVKYKLSHSIGYSPIIQTNDDLICDPDGYIVSYTFQSRLVVVTMQKTGETG